MQPRVCFGRCDIEGQATSYEWRHSLVADASVAVESVLQVLVADLVHLDKLDYS